MHITLTQKYMNGELHPIILNTDNITCVKGNYVTYRRTDTKDEFIYVTENINEISKLLNSKGIKQLDVNDNVKRVKKTLSKHYAVPSYYRDPRAVIDMDTGKRYKSVNDAAKDTNISKSAINNFLNGGTKKGTVCGKRFMLIEDYKNLINDLYTGRS